MNKVLTIIFEDCTPLNWGGTPEYSSIQIELTEEQQEKIKKNGPHVDRVFFDNPREERK